MKNYQEHLQQQWQLTESLAKPDTDETDSSWWTAILSQSSWATWYFHSVIYSVSNDAENYFGASVLNACLLKSAAALNYSHVGKFVVQGKYCF